jgi:hypothetical protein
MLMLVFLVMFGPKKGSIVAYRSGWFNNLDNAIRSNLRNWNTLLYRFQFTTVTSRSTSYMLISFWTFFFFFGETLLLVTFNYSTTVDTITSSSFFIIKQHPFTYMSTFSASLMYHITFYIIFLTTSAILYLINLNYSYNYNYFRQTFVITWLPIASLVWFTTYSFFQ